MKRFYRSVAAEPASGGWSIRLDGRTVRTPARAELTVPHAALAAEMAREWDAQGETIDPATMPMTGFANATIDRVLPDPASFRTQIADYAASDLFCYRAEEPAELVARQAAAWDPLLGWARQRYDASFVVAGGIMPVNQPAATLARLHAAVDAVDPWRLAGAATLTQIGGSLIGTLALLEGEIAAEALFETTSLDELWQADQWGQDPEAAARMAIRKADFLKAARYCSLAKKI